MNKKVPNIPTWNYPSTGTPIYRNTSEVPPVFDSGGTLDGLYNYQGKKYKLQNGKWYSYSEGNYKEIPKNNPTINSLTKEAVPIKVIPAEVTIESLITKELTEKGITNPYLQKAMMGIIASEGGLEGKPENMNYSKERLPEVWGVFSTTGKPVPKGEGSKYFNQKAVEYAGNPEKLAKYVYGELKAKDLGNTSSDDGWMFRGRGLNQLTGRGAYEKIGNEIGVDLVNNPELLDFDPEIQAKVAAQFMMNRLEQLKTIKNPELAKFQNFNDIDNIEDAVYLLTRANAGYGKMPSKEVLDKRLIETQKQVTSPIFSSIPPLATKPLEIIKGVEESKLINPYFERALQEPSFQDERVFNVSKNKIQGIEEILSPIQSTMKFKYGGVLFNQGGQMGMPITEFGEGGTHEENPLGGIPQGISSNGQPNLVEEGELKVKDPTSGEDFIITNNDKMVMTKEIAEKYNVPSKFIGKKLNKIGRDILRLDSKRIGDSIEEYSKNRELTSFIEAHKELTAMQNAKDAAKKEQDFIKEITELQEEYPEYMQALLAANQPSPQGAPMSPEEQMMMEQQMMGGQMPNPEMPSEMPMMKYGGSMYNFGGIMRGVGQGLEAVSGIASMIPGVGTGISAATGAVGAGLQNVGTGAGFGEVMADAGIGALNAVNAVPGVGRMLGQSIQGLVPNSPITQMNGGRLYDNGGEPKDEKKEKLLGTISGKYPQADKSPEKDFWELSPNQQQIVAYRAGYTMGQDDSGNVVFIPRKNPGVLSTHTAGLGDLEKEGKVIQKRNPNYYLTSQPKEEDFINEFVSKVDQQNTDSAGLAAALAKAQADAKLAHSEAASKWHESTHDYVTVNKDKIVEHEPEIAVATGWDPYYRETTSIPRFSKTLPILKAGEDVTPYYFNSNRELFTPEVATQVVPQTRANGGGINPIPTSTPPPTINRLDKLIEARRTHVEQMPFDIAQNRANEYQRWEDSRNQLDNAIIKEARTQNVDLNQFDFLPKIPAPTTQSLEEAKEKAFKDKLMSKYGKPDKTFQTDFRLAGETLKYGGNMFQNGTPSDFGYDQILQDYINQNPIQGEDFSANVIPYGPQGGTAPNLEYKQGLEGLLPLAPIAYNLYQGMQKPDNISTDRYYNPVTAPTLDYSEVNKEGRRLFAGTQRGLTETGSPGAYAANLGNVYSKMQEGYAKNIQEQENRQAMIDYQANAQNATMKTASTQQADSMNMQMELMRQGQLASGMTQLGQLGRDIEANKMGLNYANMMAPDFQLKYSNIFDRMLGNKNKTSNNG
jgi:putative chitinase